MSVTLKLLLASCCIGYSVLSLASVYNSKSHWQHSYLALDTVTKLPHLSILCFANPRFNSIWSLLGKSWTSHESSVDWWLVVGISPIRFHRIDHRNTRPRQWQTPKLHVQPQVSSFPAHHLRFTFTAKPSQRWLLPNYINYILRFTCIYITFLPFKWYLFHADTV